MKKLITLLAVFATIATFAQAPQGFNYQATVRNSAGALIVNQNVNFKFNIMLNSATSLPVFSETHMAPTDDLGQVNLVIGTGTATVGTFSTINWGTGNYYLGIELNTGSGYVAMGTTQLLSVPYALYANSAGSSQSQGKTSIYLTGDITNAEAAARIASELGPETENIYIRNTTQLTSVDLSSMSSAVNIEIEYNEGLTSVNLNGLITIYNNLFLSYNPILTSILFNNLTVSECIRINNNNSLSSISLNSLQKVNRIFYGSAPPIGLSITDNVNLQSVSLPVLINVYQIDIYGNSLLSLDLPSLNKILSGYIYVGNNKLSSTSVNSLLNKFLTVLPASGKNINLQGQTPPAPPTGQGVIDKQTLITAGNSVITDGFLPTVTTAAVTSITSLTATSGGTITYDGAAGTVTSRGIVWATTANPTITSNIGITSDGTLSGTFTSNLSGLISGTTYYVRAYATYNGGTSYGQEIVFSTITLLPTVNTGNANYVASAQAVHSGGSVILNGGGNISARGVVWGTFANPTISSNIGFTSDGTGGGSFSSYFYILTPGSTHYLRAYATNAAGTAYGQQISFETPSLYCTPGNVIINNQIWSGCNLNVDTYSDGTPIPEVTDPTAWSNLTTGAWYSPGGEMYGKLYNWYAVAGIYDVASLNNPSLRKQLAPTGWHIPTNSEWNTLTTYLGGESVAGGKLKEIGTGHWLSPNTDATNSSGFNAFPGGYRWSSGEVYNSIGMQGGWWSLEESDILNGMKRGLSYNSGGVSNDPAPKKSGNSVRCIKN
jgi:uncharacterized protein (TIGR02145 family)